MPLSYVWTNAIGDSNYSTAGNWTEINWGFSAVPTSIDYAYFGGTFGTVAGSDTPCLVDAAFAVDRVIMDNTGSDAYTSTMTIPGGSSLATNNFFQQAGTLALTGGTASSNVHVYINGTLTASNGSSTLSAGGTVFLTGPAVTITPGDALLITSHTLEIDPSETVTLGTGSGLSFTGSVFEADAGSTITLNAGTLAFAGTPTALIRIEGTVTMTGATITSNDTVIIDNGTLNALNGETINGDLSVINLGTINVGTPFLSTTLTMPSGSLTVGSTLPATPSTGGTVNVYGSTITVASNAFTIKGDVNMYGATITSDLDIRSAPGGQSQGVLNVLGGGTVVGNVTSSGTINVGDPSAGSTLTVTGDVSVPGQLNLYNGSSFSSAALAVSGVWEMYGASASASSVVLSGTLRTRGATGDSITTPLLTNTGTIRFFDAVHVLALTGGYTQGSTGNLEMRLANGQISDLLSVGGTTTLAGTLRITALAALNAGQTWTLITAGAFVPDFTNKILPDGVAAAFNPFTGFYEAAN